MRAPKDSSSDGSSNGSPVMPRQRGFCAEELAARYLQDNGWTVLARNYQTRRGEVDLVVAKDVTLAFVEVRYRRSLTFGSPEETITRAKQRRVILAALDYAWRNNLLDSRVLRFDVVAIMPGPQGPRIEHLVDAFPVDASLLTIQTIL